MSIARYDERTLAVIEQCTVVEKLAENIAAVHRDKAMMFAMGGMPSIVEITGANTASIMESLGDILNNMDAVLPEDSWMDPIFERAQEFWPQTEQVQP